MVISICDEAAFLTFSDGEETPWEVYFAKDFERLKTMRDGLNRCYDLGTARLYNELRAELLREMSRFLLEMAHSVASSYEVIFAEDILYPTDIDGAVSELFLQILEDTAEERGNVLVRM